MHHQQLIVDNTFNFLFLIVASAISDYPNQ